MWGIGYNQKGASLGKNSVFCHLESQTLCRIWMKLGAANIGINSMTTHERYERIYMSTSGISACLVG